MSFSNMFNPGCGCCGRFCLGVKKDYQEIGWRVNIFDPNFTGMPAQILQAISTLITPYRSRHAVTGSVSVFDNVDQILYEELEGSATLDPTEWITPEVHSGSFRHSLGWPGTTSNIHHSGGRGGYCPFRSAHSSGVWDLRDPDEVFVVSPGQVTANPYIPTQPGPNGEYPHYPLSLVSEGLKIRIRVVIMRHGLKGSECGGGGCNPDLFASLSLPVEFRPMLSRCTITIQAFLHVYMRWIKRSDETFNYAGWGYPGDNTSGEQIVTRLPVGFSLQVALENPKDKIEESQWRYTPDRRLRAISSSGLAASGIQPSSWDYGQYLPDYPDPESGSNVRHRVGFCSETIPWFTNQAFPNPMAFGPPDTSRINVQGGGAVGLAFQTGGEECDVEIEMVRL